MAPCAIWACFLTPHPLIFPRTIQRLASWLQSTLMGDVTCLRTKLYWRDLVQDPPYARLPSLYTVRPIGMSDRKECERLQRLIYTSVGWCWSTSSSMGRSLLIRESGGKFQVVPGVRDGVFRWIRTVPGLARPIPLFYTMAAADRKCGPWCVRG